MNLQKWFNEAYATPGVAECMRIIVGCKIDLAHKRQVNKEQAVNLGILKIF